MARAIFICFAIAAFSTLDAAPSLAFAKGSGDPDVSCKEPYQNPTNKARIQECTFAGAGSFNINGSVSISGNQPGDWAILSIVKKTDVCGKSKKVDISGETTVAATCKNIHLSRGKHNFSLDLDYPGNHPLKWQAEVERVGLR